MGEFVKFGILGFGAGGAYALLALGIVLIYKGSGVVNFAQGAIGLLGAIVFYEMQGSIGTVAAAILGTLVAGAVGVLIQVGIMRPLRRATPLMRVVATLAIVAVVTEGATIKYGGVPAFVSAYLPNSPVSITSSIIVSESSLIILGITVVLTAVLWAVYRMTRFGLATAAAAENARASASLGWSPGLLAMGNWAAGGALAGFAGILLLPLTGLSATTLTLAVVPALAASLLGGFTSFPLTLAGGLLIGIIESETSNYVSTPGWSEAIPFLLIIVVLVVRGQSLPLRGHSADRLPRLGTGHINWTGAVVGIVLAGVSIAVFTSNWNAAMMTAGVFGFISLSLVVIIGYAGQLSLAQFAFAGIGALIAGRLADAQLGGLPFLLAALIGVVVAVCVGALVALPAVRIRGVQLAVVTLGFAVVVSDVILANPAYTGGVVEGTVDPPPSIGGYSLDPVAHANRYAAFGIVLFVLAALAVANLRRGRAGRRLIAVRNNERAAASLGVSLVSAKIYAFSFAAGLAAIGGVLLAFQSTNVQYSQFDVLTSVNVILIAVIGGIGYIGAAIFGGLGAQNGPIQLTLTHWFSTGDWYILGAGVLTLVTLVLNPDGVSANLVDQMNAVRRRLPKLRPPKAWVLDEDQSLVPHVPPKSLSVEGLSVRYGGVQALKDVSLSVNPGEVVGLIGPNGAGKTTLIDAVTGFVRNYDGSVRLDGRSIDRAKAVSRSRSGLTRSFQSLELFEDLTVADNFRTASDRRDVMAFITDLVAPGKAKLSPQAVVAVKEFGLASCLDNTPSELPYAQRRLVGIARSVAASPSILLLDEPAAGLDERSTKELGDLIHRLAHDWGMGILLVEHDVQMVLGVCDRIVVLDFGEILSTGTPEEIRSDAKVIQAYLGDRIEEPTPEPVATGASADDGEFR